MTNATDNERKVLRSLLTNDYGNGPTYAWVINHSSEPSGVEGKALSGVVASLSKKGFVRCEGTGEDATVGLTAEGLLIARS